ncbi:unnamed protein product [Polarella glacialis]|uniref:Uncharacterized protein n=1 Tax=Polarella glacialis TaxID=89957 RepID=A0A813E117_POLGL|nr:unnamed protein product [Polarella glacialis]
MIACLAPFPSTRGEPHNNITASVLPFVCNVLRSISWTEAGRLVLASLAPIPNTRGEPHHNITASVLPFVCNVVLDFLDCGRAAGICHSCAYSKYPWRATQ